MDVTDVDFSRHRVLVAEDTKVMRTLEVSILKNLGVTQIDEAADGIEARRLLQKHHYEMVLCDWEMPEVTGLDLLRQIRHNISTRDIAFVMCTSVASRNDIIMATKAGATDYIVKPFSPQLLQDKLLCVLKAIPAPAIAIDGPVPSPEGPRPEAEAP